MQAERRQRSQPGTGGACFICGKRGHFAKECREKKEPSRERAGEAKSATARRGGYMSFKVDGMDEDLVKALEKIDNVEYT